MEIMPFLSRDNPIVYSRNPFFVRRAIGNYFFIVLVFWILLGCNLGKGLSGNNSNDEYVFLFNGQGLSEWVNVNSSPQTWICKDDYLICTGSLTGNLRSKKQYENYILEMEWMDAENHNSMGILIHADALPAPGQPFPRGIKCKMNMTTGQADFVTAINGARMQINKSVLYAKNTSGLRDEQVKSPGKWNQYRVVSSNGKITIIINGKIAAKGIQVNPRKGYIILTSGSSEVNFRNIRIKELPSAEPAPQEIATLDEGFQSIYNSGDLSAWHLKPGHLKHWTAKDWVINYDGKSEEKDKSLWSKKEYKDFILTADVRLTRKPEMAVSFVILPNGENALNEDGSNKEVEVPYAGDTGIYLRGNSKSQVNIGNRYIGSGEIYGYRVDKKLPLGVRADATPKIKADKPPGEWNRFVITMKGERVTVMLNNQLVIDNALLPGIPARGAIALQDDHADNNTFQFANLFIKELN